MINTEFFVLQQLKTTENRWIRQGECMKIGSEEEQKTEVVFVHVILLLIFSSSLHLRSSFTLLSILNHYLQHADGEKIPTPGLG